MKSARGLSSSWELVKGPFPLPPSLKGGMEALPGTPALDSLGSGSASEGWGSGGTAEPGLLPGTRSIPSPTAGKCSCQPHQGKRAGVETTCPHESGSLTGAVQRFHFSPQD